MYVVFNPVNNLAPHLFSLQTTLKGAESVARAMCKRHLCEVQVHWAPVGVLLCEACVYKVQPAHLSSPEGAVQETRQLLITPSLSVEEDFAYKLLSGDPQAVDAFKDAVR